MEIKEIIIKIINMDKMEILKYIEAFGILATAVGANVFGWKQFAINKRMKELQDYVAVSIIPVKDLRLQIVNVGRANLYIHKWEVGKLNEKFERPVLIPAPAGTDSNPHLLIGLQGLAEGEYNLRMYITDEKDKKYISTGKIFIDLLSVTEKPLSMMIPAGEGEIQKQQNYGQITTTVKKVNLRAYSYKIEEYNWNL